jgi:hypothetical protein
MSYCEYCGVLKGTPHTQLTINRNITEQFCGRCGQRLKNHKQENCEVANENDNNQCNQSAG